MKTARAESEPRGSFALRGASFQAPASWKPEILVTFTADGPTPKPTITLSRVGEPGAASLDTVCAQRVAAIARELALVEVVDLAERPLPGGRAMSVRLTFEELEGPSVFRLFLAQLGDRQYVVTGQALANRAATLDAAFDHVCATLRPAPPAGR